MIVAFYHPHNEGVVAGIITEAGFDSEHHLTDTHEVDADMKSFETMEEVEDFMREYELDVSDFRPVKGGLLHTAEE